MMSLAALPAEVRSGASPEALHAAYLHAIPRYAQDYILA